MNVLWEVLLWIWQHPIQFGLGWFALAVALGLVAGRAMRD